MGNKSGEATMQKVCKLSAETGARIAAKLNYLMERGLYLNNLFQLDDKTWQANVRDNEGAFEFGRGNDPVIALEAAIRALSGDKVPFINKETKDKFDAFLNS